jgi:hypothetical protein
VTLLETLPVATRAAATLEILEADAARTTSHGLLLAGAAWVASGRT